MLKRLHLCFAISTYNRNHIKILCNQKFHWKQRWCVKAPEALRSVVRKLILVTNRFPWMSQSELNINVILIQYSAWYFFQLNIVDQPKNVRTNCSCFVIVLTRLIKINRMWLIKMRLGGPIQIECSAYGSI